jgi:hypothetical protein
MFFIFIWFIFIQMDQIASYVLTSVFFLGENSHKSDTLWGVKKITTGNALENGRRIAGNGGTMSCASLAWLVW